MAHLSDRFAGESANSVVHVLKTLDAIKAAIEQEPGIRVTLRETTTKVTMIRCGEVNTWETPKKISLTFDR